MNATMVLVFENGYDENGITTGRKELGEITYDSTNRALQNAQKWYSDEIAEYTDKGLYAEVVFENVH